MNSNNFWIWHYTDEDGLTKNVWGHQKPFPVEGVSQLREATFADLIPEAPSGGKALDALERIKVRLCRCLKLEKYDSTDFLIVKHSLTQDHKPAYIVSGELDGEPIITPVVDHTELLREALDALTQANYFKMNDLVKPVVNEAIAKINAVLGG